MLLLSWAAFANVRPLRLIGGRVRVGVATVPEPVGHACVGRKDAPG